MYGLGSFSYLPAIMFLLFSFAVLIYVYYSLGLYTIAKRRGLRYYGLAWVPIANYWLLGCVADQYDNAHTGKNLKLRKHLLWLSIVYLVIYIIMYVIMINTIIGNMISYPYYDNYVTGLIFFPYLMLLIVFPLLFAIIIFQYIALYKLYRSCSPDNAVVLLVFSITFIIIIPFVLFALRKKDKGMPILQAAQETQT